MGYDLGVDLGTTFVSAAIARESRVEMFALGDHTVVAPAVVALRDDGVLEWGDAAVRTALSSPDRSAGALKRRLDDPEPVVVGDTSYRVTTLLGMLLHDVVARVTEAEGAEPDHVVLTRPAGWDASRRDLFDEVPEIAGLTGTWAVTEPEAAAAHHAASGHVADGDIVAVYDLGGANFDATVLRRQYGGIDVIGTPAGIDGLGGVGFDEAIMSFVNYASDGALVELDIADPRTAVAMARLRRHCVLAKESLSVDDETVIPVVLPHREFDVRLSRADFEYLIRSSIESTVDTLVRALGSAEVEHDALAAVLLVGGAARIPLVSQILAEEVGRPVVLDANPKYAVALGAAALARTDTDEAAEPAARSMWSDGGVATIPRPRSGQDDERVAVAVGAGATTEAGTTTGRAVPAADPDPDPAAELAPAWEEDRAPEQLPAREEDPAPEQLPAWEEDPAWEPESADLAPDQDSSPTSRMTRVPETQAVRETAEPAPDAIPPDPRWGDAADPSIVEDRWAEDRRAEYEYEGQDLLAPVRAAPPVPGGSSEAGPRRRPPWVVIAAVAAVVGLGLLAGLGYVLWSRTGAGPAAGEAPLVVAASVPDPPLGPTVTVGQRAEFVVVSPDGRRAYVADPAAGVVTVLDTGANQVTATIPVPTGPPQYLAFSPDGRMVYVSIWDEARTVAAVDVLDTTTNTIAASIPVQTRPYISAVTPDGSRLYVPNHDSGTVSVIDTGSNTVSSEIIVAANPHWVEISPDGTRAYTANHESNLVSVIDTADNSIVAEVPVQTSPHSIAVHPTRPLVANVNYDAASVTMIDTNTDRVVAALTVGSNPRDVTWSPDGRFAYVVNGNDNTVSVIDADTMAVTATIPTGPSPTSVAVLPDGRAAYVSNAGDGTLTVLNIGG